MEAELLHIFTVKLGFDRNLQLVTTVDLSPTGESGTDIVGAVFVALGDEVVLIPKGRTGTDDAHLAGEDTPELGQLVDTELAVDLAHFGDPLAWVCQKVGGHIGGSLGVHGAEFGNHEGLFMKANSLLPKKNGAFGVKFDDERKDQHWKRQNDQAAQRQDYINKSFEEFLIHYIYPPQNRILLIISYHF